MPEGSDPRLPARVEELEIRLAHLEYTLQVQEGELLRLQQQNQTLVGQVRELSERVQAVSVSSLGNPADEPPPPHY